MIQLVKQLAELREGPKKDDYGRLRPTRHAFDRARQLLVNIKAHRIPAGRVSTDSEGGVRIDWVRPMGSVHLVVPATGDRVTYIYHEVDNDYATEDVTPERLAYWLRRIK